MPEPNFLNRTVWTGDNLDVLRGMNSKCVDLIYLDPPFNSNQAYSAPIGSKAAGAAFKDTWTLDDVDEAWHGEIADREPALYSVIGAAGDAHGAGMKSYLIMMAVRLLEMRRVLKPTGSIYLHCDPTANAYLRMVMDAVFEAENFCNEIVWRRAIAHNDPKRFGRIGDRLLFYVREGGEKTFNPVMGELSSAQQARYKYEDECGRFKAEQLTAPRYSPTRTVEWRGVHPGSNRQWRYGIEALERLHKEGRILLRRDGLPRKDGLKEYLHESAGAPVQEIWTDIVLAPTSGERTGYPTQKPLKLLDRIIRASSNEGDMVLDPFCGCATTCVAAETLNRQWAGIDLSPLAVKLVDERLRDRHGVFGQIIARTDIPKRTDLGKLPNYRTHRHTLYGRQEGYCNGCKIHFPFKNLTVDHIVPRAKAGSHHIENLQLLCGYCNSLKGQGTHAELLAKLAH